MVDRAFIEARTTDITLHDGTRVRLRPVVPEDKSSIQDAFERMSPGARYRRFLSALRRLSPDQLVFLTEVDYHDHFAWVAVRLDDQAHPGLGVGRYVRLPERPDEADVAVAVVDDHQGRGLGTLLLEAVVVTALNEGITRFVTSVLADNERMRAAFRSLGASSQYDGAGVVKVTLDLPDSAAALVDHPLRHLLRSAAAHQGE